MIDKALLTGAFEKMGPERVERMLLAFGLGGDVLSYCRCALGFAAGYDNDNGERLNRDASVLGFLPYLAHRLGITDFEAEIIENAHFDRRNARGRQFCALANEWLENRPASLRDDTRETAVCVGAGPTTETHT